jgi:hypothetical protein
MSEQKDLIKKIKGMSLEDFAVLKEVVNNIDGKVDEPEIKKEEVKETIEPTAIETKKEEVSDDRFTALEEQIKALMSNQKALMDDKPFGAQQKIIKAAKNSDETYTVDSVFTDIMNHKRR